MTAAGKVEAACGVMTGSLGAVAVPLSVVADALKSPRGADAAGLAAGAVFLLLFFITPSLLVAYGSYLHAAYGEAHGRGLVAVGSLFLTITFGVCLFTAGYGAGYLIWTRLLLVIVALAAWIAAGRGANQVVGRESQN